MPASEVLETHDSKVSGREPERSPKEYEVKFPMFQEMHEDDVRDLVNKLADMHCYEGIDTEKMDKGQLEEVIQKIVHKHCLSELILTRA